MLHVTGSHRMGTWCTMPSWSLKASLLLLSLFSVAADSVVQCPPNLGYPDGLTQLSDWLNVGSVAKFICPAGQYAWPVSSRMCQDIGQWSAMTSSTGRKIRTILCKKMRCPDPSNFENGYYYPGGVFQVGSNVTFVCNDGYTLRGSMVRTCRKNAKWSGETAVCDDGAAHCADPGVPPGAVKTGNRYDIGESVLYTCTTGLNMMGSANRTCLENRHWSGSEVSCEYPYAFDLPEDVGRKFAGSLSGVVQTSKKKETVGRTVKIQKDGILNVYLLLDASQSVGEKNFQTSKECAEILVNGLGKFDMTVQFGILSYATDPEIVIGIQEQDADDLYYVLDMIEEKLLYSAHEHKSGTNIKNALKAVYDMMSFQETRYKDKQVWNSIHHVIILLTDGKVNVGGSPVDTIKNIKNFLNITQDREDYLDIYAFGIGDEIKPEDLQKIASNKRDEKHVFILQNTDDLKKAFQNILDIKKYGEMCGLNIESSDPQENFPHPWNVLIKSPSTSPCFGSLISSQWVLTAAHCFKEGILPEAYLMEIGDHTYKGSEIKIHECYKLRRKEAIGVREDYDYDVALIKLEKEVTFSKKARPICIPCTEPANRAMKQAKTATCDNHRETLLKTSEIPAAFLAKVTNAKPLTEMAVTIKHNKARDDCLAAIKQYDKFKDITAQDLVSQRHFCVEGDMSCKGESGGALFVGLRNRQRFFQMGILSFGIYNPCQKPGTRTKSVNARDFYVNVLEVLPFLQKHLAADLEFLPGIKNPEEVVCPS